MKKRFDGVRGAIELTFWDDHIVGSDADQILVYNEGGNSYHARMNIHEVFYPLLITESGTAYAQYPEKMSVEGARKIAPSRRGNMRSQYNGFTKELTITGSDMGYSLSATFNEEQIAAIQEWIKSPYN